MGKNGQKIMKKNEKILDISLEINATILHTPACTQKWWTEAMGWPIGVRKLCKNGKNWGNGHKWAKNNKKKWKSFRYLTWNQCNYTSHTSSYPKVMNRGHGVAHGSAQMSKTTIWKQEKWGSDGPMRRSCHGYLCHGTPRFIKINSMLRLWGWSWVDNY